MTKIHRTHYLEQGFPNLADQKPLYPESYLRPSQPDSPEMEPKN